MAEYPIDLVSSHRQEQDGSYTVTLTISGLPSLPWAQRASDWLRNMVRERASEIGRLGKAPARQ